MTQIAMVTGAGSGIGRGTALKFLELGYQVFLVGRRADALEETKSLAGENGARGFPVATDVSDPVAVTALYDVVREQAGRLDVVFNNAGTNAPAVLVDELPFEDWSRVIGVNLTGVFLIAQGAFALMRTQQPQGGRIINNGSVSAQAPRPNSIAYTASKFGVSGITRSLSLDGRPFSIACGQIDIGNAQTELSDRIGKGIRQADGSIKAEPMMDLTHVVDAVVYMAGLPLSANVQFMTVMATSMPLVGRG